MGRLVSKGNRCFIANRDAVAVEENTVKVNECPIATDNIETIVTL
jgi:hypothetical protein